MKNVTYLNWQTTLFIFCSLFAMMVSIPIDAKEPILIIRIEGNHFENAVLGLKEELTEEFLWNEMIITRKTSKYKVATTSS